MKISFALTAAASAALAVASPSKRASSISQVTVKGNAFFTSDGNRFYIRGVDYQPGGSSQAADPIADVSGCKRDVAKFKKLGINVVRVYTVDNTASHDECMSELADAGIYLALDVNTPLYSLNRADVARSYNDVYLQNVFATIDAFQKYDNTLLFFSGNEVINDDNTTNCAPYIKAVTRDMRQYISSMGYRKIPVGYSAADVESNRYEMATYMNCGTDDQRSDFYAWNDYSWCDPSSLQTSGWAAKAKQYADYSIPLFLSEYGCITNQRTFGEVEALYGSTMTPVFSGGLVYEYSEESSGYGLVKINGDSVTETQGFSDLATELSKSKASGDGGYKSSGKASECPAASSKWQVNDFTGTLLPAMPSGAEKYLKSGAGKGAGLSGSGSQTAGTESQGTATAGSAATTGSSSKKSGASLTMASPASMLPFIVAGFFVMIGTQLL